MRKQLRSQQWQAEFLARTVAERIAFADKLRQQSQTESARKEHNIMDVNEQTVIDTLRHFEVTTMVHGHTHKPAQHAVTQLSNSATRWVVGDWHADHAIYAELDIDGLSLKTYRR